MLEMSNMDNTVRRIKRKTAIYLWLDLGRAIMGFVTAILIIIAGVLMCSAIFEWTSPSAIQQVVMYATIITATYWSVRVSNREITSHINVWKLRQKLTAKKEVQ